MLFLELPLFYPFRILEVENTRRELWNVKDRMECYMGYETSQKQICQKLPEELTAEGLPSGVEMEPEAPFPFDAEKISISNKVVPLETLLRRLRQQTISSPFIQRGESIWGDDQQSRLIESLMLRIPLPLFYVAADINEKWKVVDGLQRITAMRRFILDGDFSLCGLEFLHDCEGKKFDSLSIIYQNRILETELQFAVIGPSTPENVQRNIFKRLNTGGMPLTAQEIRHALYYGPSAELLQEFVGLNVFKKATGNVNDSRMAGRELILRYLAFLIFGPDQYPSSGDMDSFLCNTMKIINNPTMNMKVIPQKPRIVDKIVLKEYFCRAMTRAEKLFGRYAFRKSLPGFNVPLTPVNKTLFEVWSYFLSMMSDDMFSCLLDNKKLLYSRLNYDVYEKDDGKFLNSISRYSHMLQSVQYRYKVIKDLILNITR